jgi:hypothetical protein
VRGQDLRWGKRGLPFSVCVFTSGPYLIRGPQFIHICTVYFHLVEKNGFKNYLLRWVPPLLTDEGRLKRVELARQLLELLEDQRIVGFSDIVTEDES